MLGRTFAAALIACISDAVLVKQWGRSAGPTETIETTIEPISDAGEAVSLA